MKYLYGPVPSRRLGFSLGVDLIPRKICSFDCIYCQLGKTSIKTIKRFSFVKPAELKKELRQVLKGKPRIDYITISGSGEPTLHKNLDKIISAIKRTTKNKYPLCLITNSSLLYKKEVRRELKNLDLIIPSLDAAIAGTFQKINRPYKHLAINRIIQGLRDLRKEFKGKIWLEIMLVGGINDTIREITQLKEAIALIRPDKVQLNLPVRPAAHKISLPSLKKLRTIKELLGEKVEIITFFRGKKQGFSDKDLERRIISLLKRRPATLKDLASVIGKNQVTIKNLKRLCSGKRIKQTLRGQRRFFYVP